MDRSTRNSQSTENEQVMCHTCVQQIRAVETEKIDCLMCLHSFHTSCGKVTSVLMKELKKAGAQSVWYCSDCIIVARKMAVDFVRISARVEQLETVNMSLTSRINALEGVVGTTASVGDNAEDQTVTGTVGGTGKPSYANVASRGISMVQSCVDKTLQEIRDREARASNLIIRGIEESNEDDGTARRQHDKDKLVAIASQLNVNDISIAACHRIGSKNADKMRPVRITLNDSSQRKALLRASKNLMDNAETEGVFIGPDLTRAQLQADYNLRVERRDRQSKGESVKIYRGKLISTKPQTTVTPQADANDVVHETVDITQSPVGTVQSA